MKTCSVCKISKALSEFSRSKHCSQGVRPNCKSCGVIESSRHREKVRGMWARGELTRPVHKRCPTCGKGKPSAEFAQVTTNIKGLEVRCNECEKARARAIREECQEARLLSTLKLRSRQNGLLFDLTIDDIVIPDRCPVLDIQLSRNNRAFSGSSPSADRIVPSRGYTKGNIIIVSNRANLIKRDATIEELIKIADFYKKMVASHE